MNNLNFGRVIYKDSGRLLNSPKVYITSFLMMMLFAISLQVYAREGISTYTSSYPSFTDLNISIYRLRYDSCKRFEGLRDSHLFPELLKNGIDRDNRRGIFNTPINVSLPNNMIENIVFIVDGQQGVGEKNDRPSALTGHPDDYKDDFLGLRDCGEKHSFSAKPDSLYSKLRATDWFPLNKTYWFHADDHQYTWGTAKKKKEAIRKAYTKQICSKVGTNTKRIYLAGASRGGALVLEIAKRIKDNPTAFNCPNMDNVHLYVHSFDAVFNAGKARGEFGAQAKDVDNPLFNNDKRYQAHLVNISDQIVNKKNLKVWNDVTGQRTPFGVHAFTHDSAECQKNVYCFLDAHGNTKWYQQVWGKYKHTEYTETPTEAILHPALDQLKNWLIMESMVSIMDGFNLGKINSNHHNLIIGLSGAGVYPQAVLANQEQPLQTYTSRPFSPIPTYNDGTYPLSANYADEETVAIIGVPWLNSIATNLDQLDEFWGPEPDAFADKIAKALSQMAPNSKLILLGKSLGACKMQQIAEELYNLSIPVDLLIIVDGSCMPADHSAEQKVIFGNVETVYNFRQTMDSPDNNHQNGFQLIWELPTIGQDWVVSDENMAPDDQLCEGVGHDGIDECEALLNEIDRVITQELQGQGNTSILSNSSWKSFDINEAGWTDVNYDDSHWRQAYAPYPNPDSPTQWITDTAGVFIWDYQWNRIPSGTSGPDDAYFRKSFTLPAGSFSAQAIVAADDDFDLYVNGQLVFSDDNGVLWGAPYTINIGSYLYEGENVIAIHGKDSFGINEWLLFDASIKVLSGSPRITDGLQVLYDFKQTENADVVADVSNIRPALDLMIDQPDKVSWINGGGLAVHEPNLIASNEFAEKIINAAKQSNEITIEAWVKPKKVDQDGPARIVTLSRDPFNRNFTLGQGLWGDRSQDVYDIRLRSTTSNNNNAYPPSLSSVPGSLVAKLSHIVYTRDALGLEIIYVDGEFATYDQSSGDLSNWDDQMHFALANELTYNRPWLGEYHLVAIYNRALPQWEVQQNFKVGVLR